MEPLLDKLANIGGVGILAAVLLYQSFSMTKKLYSVIDNNTKMLQELRDTIRQYFERSR